MLIGAGRSETTIMYGVSSDRRRKLDRCENQRRVGRFLTSLAIAGQFDARRTGAAMTGRKSIRSSSPDRKIVRLLAFNFWMAIDSAGILSSDNRQWPHHHRIHFYANYLRRKRARKETWRVASSSSVGLGESPETEMRSHANCEFFYLREKLENLTFLEINL